MVNRLRGRRAELNTMVRAVLIVGVLVSIGFIFTGITLLALSPTPTSGETPLISELIPEALRLNSLAFLSLAILALILTPIFRVITGLAVFITQKEHLYASASFTVLTILLLSLLLALL